MINKKNALFLSILLASSVISAQPLQLSNGDILEVELVYQTDKMLTFSHVALGEQTIDKAKISNLQEINLADLVKLSRTQVDNVQKVKTAEAKISDAKGRVDTAKAELIAAKVFFDKAKRADSKEKLNRSDAEERLVLAGKKFTTAKEEVKVAENELKVTKDVIEAETQLSEAQTKLGLAKTEVMKVGEKSIAEALGVVTADVKVDIAEDNLNAAVQQVQEAENNLKLAKGEKVNNGFMGTGWFKDWDSSLSIGLSGSAGSSVNSTFRTAFNTRYEDKKGRWDYKSFYFFDSEDTITGENQINATLVKDWFFEESKWFAFATGVYDWDQFKDWNHRFQFGGGSGYQFIKTDEWEFSGRAGATLITEFGKTQYDSNNAPTHEENIIGLEGLIGADATWHISPKQYFSISNYFYPGFTDGGAFRNLTNISWVHSLDWFEGLALKFGIRNEYDTSETIPNEFNYNFSILWGF
jgi:putative salt-induced outer membrane protein YdiY